MLIYPGIYVSFTTRQWIWASIVTIGVIVFAETLIIPVSNKSITAEISHKMTDWENGKTKSLHDSTLLFQSLMNLPGTKAFQTGLFFFIGSILVSILYHIIPTIALPWERCLMTAISAQFITYLSVVVTYYHCEKITNHLARNIQEKGLDESIIRTKRHFGLSLSARTFMYLIIPVLFCNGILFLILSGKFGGSENLYSDSRQQILKTGIITGLNIFFLSNCFYYYFNNLRHSYSVFEKSMSEIITTGSTKKAIRSSLGDLLQCNIYRLDKIVKRFGNLFNKADSIGKSVQETSDNLSVIAQQLASTSLEQNASIKEVLTTMEDSSALSQNISTTTANVSSSAERTYHEFNTSVDVLQKILTQMEEISSANASIIEGVTDLGKEIDNIGDVIAIINDIADQTRIIAFNAELEAVSAGNEGHNFHIVATEIRRLANNTMNSINEIKSYITNIQDAFQKLINSSQEGTDNINDETKLAHQLENHFDVIREMTDITSVKTNEIKDIIEQQNTSFNQIVITLRQISSGIESFTDLTKNISATANQMQSITTKLSSLQTETL
ncbi:MAG: hypothetical protein IKQ43_09220 [Treponema sp.]|nr:hypothetical protein [Treponema sp.]MBR7079001.1 hypothetical protein [Treponema sp.]